MGTCFLENPVINFSPFSKHITKKLKRQAKGRLSVGTFSFREKAKFHTKVETYTHTYIEREDGERNLYSEFEISRHMVVYTSIYSENEEMLQNFNNIQWWGKGERENL